MRRVVRPVTTALYRPSTAPPPAFFAAGSRWRAGYTAVAERNRREFSAASTRTCVLERNDRQHRNARLGGSRVTFEADAQALATRRTAGKDHDGTFSGCR